MGWKSNFISHKCNCVRRCIYRLDRFSPLYLHTFLNKEKTFKHIKAQHIMTHILNPPHPHPKEKIQKSRGGKKKTPKMSFLFIDKHPPLPFKFIVNNLHKFLPQTALLYHQEENIKIEAAVIPAHIMLPVQRKPSYYCLVRMVHPMWTTTVL